MAKRSVQMRAALAKKLFGVSERIESIATEGLFCTEIEKVTRPVRRGAMTAGNI
jgi:hypothetical protein